MTKLQDGIAKIKFRKDYFLFFLGILGLGYETLAGGAEKPTLIIAFVGMLGLPLFIKTDEDRKSAAPPLSFGPLPSSPPPTTTPPASGQVATALLPEVGTTSLPPGPMEPPGAT